MTTPTKQKSDALHVVLLRESIDPLFIHDFASMMSYLVSDPSIEIDPKVL